MRFNKSREGLKLIRVSRESWEELKRQKRIQKKSMAQIADDLILNKNSYANEPVQRMPREQLAIREAPRELHQSNLPKLLQ